MRVQYQFFFPRYNRNFINNREQKYKKTYKNSITRHKFQFFSVHLSFLFLVIVSSYYSSSKREPLADFRKLL
jgi:hypothetical protein